MKLQATTSERRAMNLLFNLFNSASNLVQNAVGINRTLDELIRDKDIFKAITIFQNRDDIVEQAIKEYNPETHKIRFKPDKQRKGKSPKITAKLSMPYQQLINEIENTFCTAMIRNGRKLLLAPITPTQLLRTSLKPHAGVLHNAN